MSYSKNQEELVEESRIHFSGDQQPVSDIEYKEGDYIEVKLSQGENEPYGWCLAKIITKRDQFCFVHYENYDTIYDEIVLVEQIRPVNTRGGPKLDETEKIATSVPLSIQEWWTTMDAVEKFNNITNKSKVYNVSYRPKDNKIVIVGTHKEVNKASILLNFIIDHQWELVELENENQKMSKNLESKKQKVMKSDSLEEVLVPKDLLGLIIGKGGANIAYVKQEFQVGIHILEHEDEDHKDYTETHIPEDQALIRIYGKDPKWVKLAKKEIHLIRTFVPIPADKVEYVKGYQNAIINDMKEKSRCIKLFVQDPENKSSKESFIEVIGNEEATDNFKMLLETHLGYYDTYKEKEAESAELNKQFTKYNTNYGEGYQGGDANRGGYNNQANKRRNKNKNY